MSIYPSRAADLIAYQQLIKDAVRRFPGMTWYVYDVEFRRRASHKLSAKWGERDVQLYLDTLTGLPKSGCRSCGSTGHLLMPALYLPVGLGMPQPKPTCATTLTKADAALAYHALTNTGVASPDAQQPTLGKTMPNSPGTERKDLNRLQVLAIPSEDTPNYLSNLPFPPPLPLTNLHPTFRAIQINQRLTIFSQVSLGAFELAI